jgi:hypothetical protein
MGFLECISVICLVLFINFISLKLVESLFRRRLPLKEPVRSLVLLGVCLPFSFGAFKLFRPETLLSTVPVFILPVVLFLSLAFSLVPDYEPVTKLLCKAQYKVLKGKATYIQIVILFLQALCLVKLVIFAITPLKQICSSGAGVMVTISPEGIVLTGVILPLLETIIWQWFPFILGAKLGRTHSGLIVISWILFFVGHISLNGLVNGLTAGLIAGWIFAYSFGNWYRESVIRSILYTWLIHALYNSALIGLAVSGF